MTQQERNHLACELSALCVFRGLLRREPMQALLRFLDAGKLREQAESYGDFVHGLAEDNYCFSDFLRRAVYEDENPCVLAAAQKRELSAALRGNMTEELRLLSHLTRLSRESLWEGLGYEGYLPAFANEPLDLEESYRRRLAELPRHGYGIFASHRMFRLEQGQIVPVRAADESDLEQFVGYEQERRQVLENTRALMEGRPAANVLLFGDAGTGKSSTVKACVNHFAGEGLRLIEIRKDQLFHLPAVLDALASNPLKFILFVDDLSFNKNDDCFSMLKAVLEGSASARADHVRIYATSNRRHLVKENFSDRGDDIHHNDTVQELLSLSDRFGLTVYFEKPGKGLYLDIVRSLAGKQGLAVDEELERQAEAYALRKGSRSPRAAEQFVRSLL